MAEISKYKIIDSATGTEEVFDIVDAGHRAETSIHVNSTDKGKINSIPSNFAVESTLSKSSTNPVQNKVIASALDNIFEVTGNETVIDVPDLTEFRALETRVGQLETQLSSIVDGDTITY